MISLYSFGRYNEQCVSEYQKGQQVTLAFQRSLVSLTKQTKNLTQFTLSTREFYRGTYYYLVKLFPQFLQFFFRFLGLLYVRLLWRLLKPMFIHQVAFSH